MTTTIPDLMNSISQVLTHAEELVAEGDSEQVGIMLTSFLKTLMVDLDKLYVDQGSTGVRPQRQAPKCYACDPSSGVVGHIRGCPNDPANKNDSPNRRPRKPKRSGKPKRPVINKYDGDCATCLRHVGRGAGFVLPNDDPNAPKRWETYCQEHNPYA